GGDGATGGGGGGGGSGGSILLRVASATLGNNLVTAIGGSGGQSGGGFTGSGGNGGVGRIRLEYAQNLFGTTSPDASKVRDIASDNASVIATQPADVTCFPKATATFNVGVTGLPQLQFQWYFNSVPVAGATNQTLVLSNLNLSQSGNYSVSISNAVMTVTSSQAVLTVLDDRDSDGDGIPNYWELQYGLDPLNKADALSHPVVNGVTNQLTYLEIYRTGLNPTNGTDMLAHPVVNGVTNRLTYLQIYQFGLDPSKLDYDGDGLTDYDEIFVYGTDPKNPDTDGDGIPDGVEVQYGMNPRVNDANESKSFDGVTNLQKYQWNLVHTNAWEQMFPNRVFSGTNTVSDYERYNPGMRYSRPVYDGNDRLIGVEYSSGVSLAYVYDGNGNLIRQKWISRASETNSLPALFTFLNNLTNSIGTGPYDDPDGDGWTNLQEQRAGTNPNDPLSKPDTAFNPGTNIASLQLPFTPRNFVMAVGQLDGLGTEEIVIGADGNPGTNTNYILILSQTFSGWSTQKVDIGSFGVTSISIGQPTNRPSAGIYLGLRQAGGTGRVWELMSSNGIWITTEIAISSDEATFVNGVREQNDVLVSQAINGLSGALFGLKCMDGLWTSTPLSTNTSHRGFGNQFRTSRAQELTTRLLDGGGIEVSYSRLLPALLANAVNRPDTSAWYLLSPVGSWQDAQAYALQMSGNLTTIKDDSENRWLGRTFSSSDLWIGLFRLPDTDKSNPTSWHWISGDQSSYRAWGANEPNDSGGPNIELYVQMTSSGFAWNDARNDHISPGIVEVINDDH
ncbi:MAG: hypothetical protein EBU46_15370, partial [Nitrosomonadaceae bacterium]|nr:hypothetical protein [Nitrosomonadaceae bacterium]